MRAELLARRDALDPADRAAASRVIAERVLVLPELAGRGPAAGCGPAAGRGPVAGYWPIRSEVDIRPALAALHDRGTSIGLPVVGPGGLAWRGWSPGATLIAGTFGLREPGPETPSLAPRILLVPLCGFDRTGARLGYGAGYYDRAIAALAAGGELLAIGVAFAAQEVERIPTEPHDRRLEFIITEREVIRAP